MEKNELALMTGIDIPIPECSLILHQPSITEISYLGEMNFFTALQCVCLNKTMFSQDKTVLSNITNFQIFMTIMKEKETADKKDLIIQFLNMILPNYQISFTPRAILFLQSEQSPIMIDNDNFEIFQEYVRMIFCINSALQEQQAFNPANARAKAIADKIMKGRKRVAEIKGGTNSIFSRYLSILSVGLQLSLQELCNLTMYQIYDLMERFSLYTAWDIDIRCRMAGGKPDKAPDDWMKDIHGK